MKKISLLLIIFCVFLTGIEAYAANPTVEVVMHGYDDNYDIEYPNNIIKESSSPVVLLFINGDIISDGDAIIKNGTTLVPLRIVSNRLEADVNWNAVTRTAVITKEDTKISAKIGDNYINVNGRIVETGSSTEIINSLTYVPLRAIANGFGAEVGFFDDIHDVKIVYVQSRADKIIVSKEEAIKKAEDLYFNQFLPSQRDYILEVWNVDVNTVNPSNISEKLNMHYIGRCKADLGEYYYIELFDNSSAAVLVDKYDGSCYTISGFSLVLLNIDYGNVYSGWGMDYQ